MANHSATKKDARQAAKRTERNKYYGKTTRNAIRDLKALKGKEMGEKFPDVAAMIDKLAKLSEGFRLAAGACGLQFRRLGIRDGGFRFDEWRRDERWQTRR